MEADRAVIERIEGPAPADDSSVPPDDFLDGIRLPAPDTAGTVPLEQALARRRSTREFSDRPLTPAQLSQLLWAAQGVTGTGGKRTAPSAGALHPLVLHLLTSAGVHRYVAGEHRIEALAAADRRPALAAACLDQDFLAHAGLVVVIGHVRRRSHDHYGVRADRYAALEAGHVAQNLLLEASVLGLAAVPIGSFYDVEVRREAELGAGIDALYVVAVGHHPG